MNYACLPLCSFAQACESRSLQAGTPEFAYATDARPCGIECRSRLPSHALFIVIFSEPPTGEARDRGKGVAIGFLCFLSFDLFLVDALYTAGVWRVCAHTGYASAGTRA
uniref:Uncharacterized protein n=1 Tax=Ananas comosus var. bracteatus TaxID=296719 RepID=A0A6V7PPE3_ANACO|nr:unnamed protein product [Ananas comosus var. bracteatus]